MISVDFSEKYWALSSPRINELNEIVRLYNERREINQNLYNIQFYPGRRRSFEVSTSGTATIRLQGVLARELNPVFQAIGGTSITQVMEHLREALTLNQITEVVLEITSPGGEVAGTQELAHLIRTYSGLKKVVAIISEEALSAGYWIAAAADKVYMLSGTARAGSIGVLSKLQVIREDGAPAVEMAVGDLKCAESPNRPMTDERFAYMKASAERLYETFVRDVAFFRGIPYETVLKNMANGEIFQGRQAIERGLVDGFISPFHWHMTGKIVEVPEDKYLTLPLKGENKIAEVSNG